MLCVHLGLHLVYIVLLRTRADPTNRCGVLANCPHPAFLTARSCRPPPPMSATCQALLHFSLKKRYIVPPMQTIFMLAPVASETAVDRT